MRKYIYIFATYLIFFSCSDYEDEILNIDTSQPVDMSLIGSAVNFQPFVESLETRAGGWKHDGQFNTGDMMYIYRQYYNKATGKWDYHTPPGTLYKYTDMNNGATGIFDKTSWKPYSGKWFCFTDENSKYINEDSETAKKWNGTAWEKDTHSYSKKLTEKDSIIWENGQTVRFRAWVLSGMGNSLADTESTKPGITTINYPDYMTCDWVTVAGPTEQIPMSMKHLGCRLGFVPREENVITKVEITTDWHDYMRNDNADSFENDQNDKAPTEEEAKARAEAVKAAYERMCWPAGVNTEDVSLLICDEANNESKYGHNDMTPEYIAESIKRPGFISTADSRYYMVTTPYDMSNDSETSGTPIILPPYTRVRIWLRDVNNGDFQQPDGVTDKPGTSENNYHIFSLADIKNSDNTEMFPNGIELKSGYSYLFTVGYWHKTFSVHAYDNFSWAEQDSQDITSIDKVVDPYAAADSTISYKWWIDAMNTAVKNTADNGDEYKPSFEIKTAEEFQEFVNIVNGNFKRGPSAGSKLEKTVSIVKDKATGKSSHIVRWYRGTRLTSSGRDTLWVSKGELIEEGYIIYNSYTPSVGTQATIIEEDYLKTPFSFFNEQVGRRWTITLSADIDLSDIPLEPIGGKTYSISENKTDTTRFAGHFDGDGHKVQNLYIRKLTSSDKKNDFTTIDNYIGAFNGGVTDGLKDGMLFAYAQDGTIANLILESTHPLSVCGKAWNERILGCAVYAPSQTGTLANEAYGNCYFIGCAHYYMGANTDYNTGAPLVNNMENHYMYGCLQAAYSTNSGQPALGIARANYLTDSDHVIIYEIQDHRPVGDVWWTRVSCNYYDTELWNGALAYKNNYNYYSEKLEPRKVRNDKDGKEYSSIHRLQYLRGVPTHIICAKNDYLVDAQTVWNKMDDNRKIEIYGVAPWKALNYGIARYNSNYSGGEDIQKCKMRYYIDEKGYANKYPELKKSEHNLATNLDSNTLWRAVLNELN